jgi:hypothetical protein
MNCEEISLLIEEFHDGQLNSPEEEIVKQHLKICPACNADFENVRALSYLLQKSSITMPSAALAQGLMDAFEKQNAKPLPLWKRLFLGSISIPKPIFAAAILLAIMSFIGANFIGRNSSNFYNAKTASIPLVNSPPEIVEKTKIVEVPVIKTVEVPVVEEKIVKQIVYVERKTSRKQKNNSGQNKELSNNSIAQNKPINLQGFQIVPEIKVKIIK